MSVIVILGDHKARYMTVVILIKTKNDLCLLPPVTED